MNRLNYKNAALLLGGAVLIHACTADQGLTLKERTVTPINAGQAGMAMSADGALRLEVPAGALRSNTEITIETFRNRTAPRLESHVWELGPSGTTFAQPVTIRVSGTTAEDDEELAIANLDGPYPEVLESSDFDRATGVVRATLEHFSSYGVVSVYNPCSRKACGDTCTICDPLNSSCVEPPPASKACNRTGLCVDSAAVTCTPPPDAGPAPDAEPEPDAEEADAGIDDDAAVGDDATTADDAEPVDSGPPACTDTFTQNAQPILDILLVVDNSGSMFEEQVALANNFNLLLDTLVQNNVDFHIGVTTTDVDMGGQQGALVGSPLILDSTTPNISAAFSANVMVGTSGSGFEQGLEAAYLALTPPMVNGANAGFLRSGASLTVVYLSDEEDQSPNTTMFYSDHLIQLVGSTDRVQANAIVGDVPNGCTGAGGSGFNGQRYIDVANATMGVFNSICTPPWSTALTDLGGSGFGYLRSFQLSMPAPGGIISVTIDGVNVPSTGPTGVNWIYDAMTNTVTFSPFATPEPGSVIVIQSGC